MPSLEKKRDLADFFKPYARARLFPGAGNVIPQKRPSPSPETENIPPARTEEPPRTTPTKNRTQNDIRTPNAPPYSPISVPRSGSLPIRSPHPKSAVKPSAIYNYARLFESSPSSCNPSPAKQKTPTPEKRQSTLSFANIPQAPTSAQSVVKEGKLVAVRDSDEDDTDSLASLDEIFGKKRDDDNTTSLSSPPEPDESKLEAERRRALSAFTPGRSEPLIGRDKLRALYAKEREHKFDISRFVNDHLDDEEVEQKVQKSREQYEQSMKALELGQPNEIDAKLLASFVQSAGGDEDDIARLMSAVSRTEALSSEKSFSFFGQSGIKDQDAEPPTEVDFPYVDSLKGLFRSYDDTGRSRAYLSGYMSELAAARKLPDEVLRWTFDSVLTEKDDYLRQSYIECLRQGSSSWVRTNVDVHDVQGLFETLGADPSNLKDSIQPRYQSLRKQPLLTSKYLLAILDLFQAICQHMDFLALACLVSIICRLVLDEELMSNGAISSKVEETLQTILNILDKETREHVTECIQKDMGQHLHAPNLQAKLISHVMPTSPTSCSLRIKLAVTFLLGPDSTSLSPDVPATTLLDTLTHHITTSSHFDTSARNARTLNYTHLRASTHILDTAIADGHRPTTFPSKSDEAAFNQSVDALADAIHATYTAIQDSGASHMSRTEAKDTLTALYWRVLVAVRTRPRPKRHIFDKVTGMVREGEAVRGEERGREFMRGFLAKVKEKGRQESEESGVGVGSQGLSEPMSSYASAREGLEGECN